MNMNLPPIDTPTARSSVRSVSDMMETKGDRLDRLFGWWYKLTMPPRPPANASIIKKEAYRRHRTISTVGILFLIMEIMDITVVIGARSMVMNVDYVLVYLFIAAMMVANRLGRPVLAGSIPVFGCEILLIFTILYMYPEMNIVSIMFYGLFVFIELLSISLLPIGFVFVFAVLDSTFIVLDYFLQPKEALLTQAIGANGFVVFGVPVALQFLVAFISALWVSTASAASKRANRAEMMAAIESAVAKDRLLADQEKRELEVSIQQLVQVYVDASHGKMVERIPYPPAKVLWPLVGVLNALWMRLRSAQLTETEFHRIKQAITAYDALLQRTAQAPNQSIPFLRTGTDIDMLNISLQAIQKSWRQPGLP
ncbi:hypothetical protein [Ktedonospora formicarum]|uniref:HAMP domain-containing protein n=1 Tax=Ktedonospora formicarum TaxID=2778364 RepID=A0A8J3MTW6_9CHLR|nr:hypothetical protein [Ktedonospora formicarum]GHO46033.1 hypothetical protein KSX_41960 [Ktedonospora formicarum]